eukprot:jgi/Ulvmu1/12585/UM092_0015.1
MIHCSVIVRSLQPRRAASSPRLRPVWRSSARNAHFGSIYKGCRRLCTAYCLRGQQSAVYEEYDVVEFLPPGGTSDTDDGPAIGCIVRIAANGEVTLEQLQREGGPEASIWTQSGDEHTIPISALQRTFEADYSQRMDTDRVSNPHGEHAHDVWEIPELL